MKKHTKIKIGVGYVVKDNVEELEKITREVRTRRIGKDVMVCVQIVVGKNKFLSQLKYGQKK